MKLPETNVTLYPFQANAKDKLVASLLEAGHKACQLQAKVGLGKTYITLAGVRDLFEQGFFDDYRGLVPVLFVTKANAIAQTMEVAYDKFKLGYNQIHITNYDQFRATFGELWIEEKTIVKLGEAQIAYFWRPEFAPRLFILDECQSLMNDSQQTGIFVAAGKLTRSYFWHVSATPFVRVSGARAFCLHARIPFTFGWDKDAPLTEERWPDFARSVCLNSSPEDFNKEACKRLMARIKDYIVRVPAIPTKYKTNNCVSMVQLTDDEFAAYSNAMNEYLENCAKIMAGEYPNYAFLLLIELLKFRQAAEKIKAPHYARAAAESIKAGKAPIIAVAFKHTIAIVIDKLVNEHGIPRSKISVIWGGVVKPSAKTATTAAKVAYSEMEEYIEDLDLGPQNHKERWEEVKKFQSGEAAVCLFTFKAGGVALSLHHHKEGQLPREVFSSLTYSVIELVQAFGRAHRINSISDTNQAVICAAGTVEETHVAPKLVKKIACLGEVTSTRESWGSSLLDGAIDENLKRAKEAMEEAEQKQLADDNSSGKEDAMLVELEDEEESLDPEEESFEDPSLPKLIDEIRSGLSSWRLDMASRQTSMVLSGGNSVIIYPNGSPDTFNIDFNGSVFLKAVKKTDLAPLGEFLRENKSLKIA